MLRTRASGKTERVDRTPRKDSFRAELEETPFWWATDRQTRRKRRQSRFPPRCAFEKDSLASVEEAYVPAVEAAALEAEIERGDEVGANEWFGHSSDPSKEDSRILCGCKLDWIEKNVEK